MQVTQSINIFFSYLLSQYNIILDSHEILMERKLWKYLVQLPAHMSYKGRPGFSGLYYKNKGWTQHTLLITRQPIPADERFSFYLVWTSFSVYARCLSSQHHHIVMKSLAPPSQLHSIILQVVPLKSSQQDSLLLFIWPQNQNLCYV